MKKTILLLKEYKRVLEHNKIYGDSLSKGEYQELQNVLLCYYEESKRDTLKNIKNIITNNSDELYIKTINKILAKES